MCRNVNKELAITALYGMVSGAIDYVLKQDTAKKVDIRKTSEDVAVLFKEAVFVKEEMPPLAAI
ncbi:MAG: hypothetical protein WBZ33_01415 [Thermoactinomyces sp.]